MENSNEKCSDFEAANLREDEPELNEDEPLPVIIDLSRVVDIDFTAAVVRDTSKNASQFLASHILASHFLAC